MISFCKIQGRLVVPIWPTSVSYPGNAINRTFAETNFLYHLMEWSFYDVIIIFFLFTQSRIVHSNAFKIEWRALDWILNFLNPFRAYVRYIRPHQSNKVTQWKLFWHLPASNKSHNNYVVVKLFHTLNT